MQSCKAERSIVLLEFSFFFTICTSNHPWVRCAGAGPSSRCGSWHHSHHTAADGKGQKPFHTLHTQYIPNSANPYAASSWWSTEEIRFNSSGFTKYSDEKKRITMCLLCYSHSKDGNTGRTEHKPVTAPPYPFQNCHTQHTYPENREKIRSKNESVFTLHLTVTTVVLGTANATG